VAPQAEIDELMREYREAKRTQDAAAHGFSDKDIELVEMEQCTPEDDDVMVNLDEEDTPGDVVVNLDSD
jgi:NACalpha-BTF3-like transcription factor